MILFCQPLGVSDSKKTHTPLSALRTEINTNRKLENEVVIL